MNMSVITAGTLFVAIIVRCARNPLVTVAGGIQRHKYTPHSCRHTFATLMKRAAGSDVDKMALIGHASDEQLRDYQDVHYEDLRRIVDAL